MSINNSFMPMSLNSAYLSRSSTALTHPYHALKFEDEHELTAAVSSGRQAVGSAFVPMSLAVPFPTTAGPPRLVNSSGLPYYPPGYVAHQYGASSRLDVEDQTQMKHAASSYQNNLLFHHYQYQANHGFGAHSYFPLSTTAELDYQQLLANEQASISYQQRILGSQATTMHQVSTASPSRVTTTSLGDVVGLPTRASNAFSVALPVEHHEQLHLTAPDSTTPIITTTSSKYVKSGRRGRAQQVDAGDAESTSRVQCHICAKQYCRRSTLKAHLRQHSGEKPFPCTSCGKRFSQAANLTAHKRVHTGEKPFSCSICCRPFSQSSSLVTHKRTHTGERPYQCTQCSKAFTDSSTLTKHLRTHSGLKPYQCQLCHLRFSQSGNLNRHVKTHTRQSNNC